MTLEVWGMMVAGIAALAAGFMLVRARFAAASGARRILVLGPVFEATALAIFAAEHFLAAPSLAPIVPRWMPAPLFVTYFVGVALLAAAVSFVAWRCVRWSATLLALFFFLIVLTLDLHSIPAHAHERLFWSLFVREIAFGAGALVLAGSVWSAAGPLRAVFVHVGRGMLASILIFYAIQHFLFPHFVPGVPLEKMTPAWIPFPVALAYFVGFTLLLAGIGLLIPRTVQAVAAFAGLVLVLLTVCFYGPIFVSEMHTPLAVEGMNYIGDTLLFAATVLLAGFSPELATELSDGEHTQNSMPTS